MFSLGRFGAAKPKLSMSAISALFLAPVPANLTVIVTSTGTTSLANRRARLFEAATGRELAMLELDHGAATAQFSPNGNAVLTMNSRKFSGAKIARL